MQERTGEPRKVVLDQAILATCAAGDDTETLRRRLREAGALAPLEGIDPSRDEGPLGALGRLQDALAELERVTAAAGAPPILRPEHGALAGGVALMLALAWLSPWAAALASVGVLWLAWHTPRQAVLGRAPAVDPELRRARKALGDAVHDLVGRDYIAAGDGLILESTPSLAWLERRREDVVRTRQGTLTRLEGLATLRQSLIRTNLQLGRPGEDAEVVALDREMTRVRADLAALEALDAQLGARRRALDEQLGRLRLVATRQALSARVGAMLEGAFEAQRLAAELELDFSELEDQLRQLRVELSDADAALRAVLETEATARGEGR